MGYKGERVYLHVSGFKKWNGGGDTGGRLDLGRKIMYLVLNIGSLKVFQISKY